MRSICLGGSELGGGTSKPGGRDPADSAGGQAGGQVEGQGGAAAEDGGGAGGACFYNYYNV